MGIFSRNSKPDQSSGKSNDKKLAPNEPPERLDESVRNKFSLEHPAWRADHVSMGTTPESTRIAMSRQFARVIGDMLGKHTDSTVASIECLKQALAVPVSIPEFDRHLHGAVETVSTSLGYDQATKRLVSHMNGAFQDASLLERLSTTAALMRETVNKTFDAMLRGPTNQDTMMSYSGDQSMCTVFGVRGRVERMSITMIPGQLAHHFKTTLEEAQQRYQAKKIELRAGEAISYDKVFSLTLNVGEKVVQVKTTQDDLVQSYNEALIRYASVSYANRVRKREEVPAKLEQGQHAARERDGV
jgi:hypothetical protein